MDENKFEEQLRKWILFFNRTRRVGHTHAAMNGVKNDKNAVLVCIDEQHRSQFQHKEKTINFNAEKGPGNIPVVFDNYTIQTILQKSLNERIDKQRVSDALKSKDQYTLQKYRELARRTKLDEFEAGYRLALQQVSTELGL